MIQPTKTEYLYGGKVEIGFYGPNEKTPHRHYYKVNGERFTSVTSVTGILDKPALIKWAVGLAGSYLMGHIDDLVEAKHEEIIGQLIETACQEHTRVKTEAATVGKNVHTWVEEYIDSKKDKGPTPDLPKDEQELNGVTAFLRWIDENKVKFISSEKLVYSKKHKYGGLMDLKATVNGELATVDFKTSNGVYDEFYMQIAAYRGADEEETGKKHDTSWIIRFGKDDGEFEAHQIEDHDADYKAFLNALALKKWLKTRI